jgi:hypothetical protein
MEVLMSDNRKFERVNKVEQVAVSELKPYEKNPRKHGKNVDEIIKSIESVGFTNPIIIDQNNRIVAGHGRHLAATKMNLTTVPCVRVELTEAEYHKLLVSDNKIGELSKWDKGLLKDCMKILDDIGSIEVPGFAPGEIEKMFGHVPDVISTPEAADVESEANFGEAGQVKVERIPAPGEADPDKPAPRLKELRVKFTAAQYKKVVGKLKGIVKEHGLESEAEAIIKALENFKEPVKTVRR